MFEGEKTLIFWLGLMILSLASVSLFSLVWFNVVVDFFNPYEGLVSLRYQVPFFVAATVFVLVGLYMMKCGTKKNVDSSKQPQLS